MTNDSKMIKSNDRAQQVVDANLDNTASRILA